MNRGASEANARLASFRTLRTLRSLNVLAVGFSLAAATGAVFSQVFGDPPDGSVGALTGLSTLLFGLVWARLLRSRATIGKSSIRGGWLASIPLAIANAMTSCGLLFYLDRHEAGQLLTGAIVGATFGVICWLPGLVATLVCFGVPIAWAQRLAKKGLAGEERGEIVVGIISVLVAVAALALTAWTSARDVSLSHLGTIVPGFGRAIVALCAVVGAAPGSLAATFAHRRERVRRAFVREVEAGDVAGYRVDPTPEGKVLVRVTSMGEGYRVANFEEPLYGLDETGEVQRSLAIGD